MIYSSHALYDDMPGLIGQLPSQIASRLEKIPHKSILAVYLAIDEAAGKNLLERYMAIWRHIEPTIDGHQLRQRGVVPGPAYREILAAIKSAWMDGNVNTQEEEALLLDQLIQGIKNLAEQ